MPADIRLIPYATETDADVFPAEGLGNARADARLARTRCPDEKQDRAGLLAVQAHHGKLLNDTPLDLLQAKMVFIQHCLCFRQGREIHVLLFPRQRCDKIQIVIKHPILVGIGALLLQTVQHLGRFLARLVVHAGILDRELHLAQIRHILRMHLIQLFLQVFHLLFDRLLLVNVLVIGLLRVLRVIRDLGDLNILIDHLLHQLDPLPMAVHGNDVITLLIGKRQPHRQGARHLADRVPLGKIRARDRPPLKVHGKFLERCLQSGAAFLLCRRVKVVRLRHPRHGQLDAVIHIHMDLVDVDTAPRADLNVAIAAHLTDHA